MSAEPLFRAPGKRWKQALFIISFITQASAHLHFKYYLRRELPADHRGELRSDGGP